MPLPEKVRTEVQELAWALVDDVISADEVKRLESLLINDAEARKLYVLCMQMQADLHQIFNPNRSIMPKLGPTSPVLTTLATPPTTGLMGPTVS